MLSLHQNWAHATARSNEHLLRAKLGSKLGSSDGDSKGMLIRTELCSKLGSCDTAEGTLLGAELGTKMCLCDGKFK